MYRFALRPRWILSHLLVATLVALMVSAGFWQLRRLDERRDHNAAVEAAADLPSEPIGQLLPAGADATDDDVDGVVYRQTELDGRYALDEQVLVRNRSQDGVPGYWVITPLVLDDGEAVAVNRGWVPFNTTDPDGNWDEFAPPSGPVSVTGLVREGQVRSSGLIGGPTDAEQGRLTTLSRVDLDRLQAQVAEQLFPVYVDLTSQAPPQGDLPVPVPEPELGEGNHLSYAGQWFIFAALTLVVYPLVLRRTARNRATADPGGGDGSGDPSGGGRPQLDRAVPGRVTSVP
jgi:surfeit locus 1 family protein